MTQFLRYGFLNVDVTQNGQNLTATFYENREGKDKDHFSFSKTAPMTNNETNNQTIKQIFISLRLR